MLRKPMSGFHALVSITGRVSGVFYGAAVLVREAVMVGRVRLLKVPLGDAVETEEKQVMIFVKAGAAVLCECTDIFGVVEKWFKECRRNGRALPLNLIHHTNHNGFVA